MVASLNQGRPARDAGYELVQYVAGRATLAGADVNVKIGTLPAGALVTSIHSKVVTAITGGTPVLGIGTASGNAAIQNVMSEAAGSESLVPLSTLVMPLAADTDVWITTSGGATAGDVVVALQFVKPLA